MNSLRQWKQLELNLGPEADMPRDHSSEEFIARHLSESPTGQVRLMESICERNNMKRAIRRVVRNKGAPGIDGMTVRQVKRRLKRHWPKIEQALLDGRRQPMPVMIGGLEEPTREGTPQGGPFSPLLSNIVLDELDKELEKRGLCFVRYADDCVIFVGSERAGSRVMESISRYIEKKLRLKVNQEKSAVGQPWERKYLGFCMTNSRKDPKIRIHWKTIKRFKERVREITARRRGRSLVQVIGELKQYMNGWWNYYGITESFNRLRPLSRWIRRRLRALVWKQWKNRRTRVRELLKRGVFREFAVTTGCARKGPWRMSKVKWVQIALPNAYFTSFGLSFPWV